MRARKLWWTPCTRLRPERVNEYHRCETARNFCRAPPRRAVRLFPAAGGAAAFGIQEKLESYLEYRIESAQMYLTEYMPVLQAGVIRRDGLTVSLIISELVSEIVSAYENRQ